MAITRPVTFSCSLIGDGVSTEMALDLSSEIVKQGFPASSVPQLILSIMMSDGSAVTGSLSGQTVNVGFAVAPGALVVRTLSMTLGF
jgi:hypothetical protein